MFIAPDKIESEKPTFENAEDILNDAITFLGGEPVIENNDLTYGLLTLSVAPKGGKALFLLADHVFSPSLFLAERVERGLLSAEGHTVIELGAGSALPSLLMAVLPNPPSLVVVTDYPDPSILGNLKKNVELNTPHFQPSCRVECAGHEWGTDVEPLLNILPSTGLDTLGYDIVILSDLVHFNDSHDSLVTSMKSLLAKSETSRIHVSAGYYTRPHVCESFFLKCKEAGFSFEEVFPNSKELKWMGSMKVGNLDDEALAIRKAACRYWVGRW